MPVCRKESWKIYLDPPIEKRASRLPTLVVDGGTRS